MYIVYVLKSLSVKKSYVGLTEDVDRRLNQHNHGLHTYTKRHIPWVVIYTELCDTLHSARIREKYLKSAAGRRFLKKAVFKK